MNKFCDFEAIQKYLIHDEHVRSEIFREFKSDALSILKSLAKGEEHDLLDVAVGRFLLDLLYNDARLYKRFTARGSYGNYHIDIKGLGGVYFYWAPEFDRTSCFLSIDDCFRFNLRGLGP